MDVYRFRSIDKLLCKHQELEKETIYFASPDQLNDPMEGLRDIVWRGDKIVWTNFFRNYVYCLHAINLQLTVAGQFIQLDTGNMPIFGHWDQLPTPQAQKLFDCVWHRFLNLPKIPDIIEALANTNRKIRYRELGAYLGTIHSVLLDEIEELHIAHRLMPESTSPRLPKGMPTVEKRFESILTLITALEEGYDEERANAAFQVIEETHDEQRIVLQMNNPILTGIWWNNFRLAIYDFPMIYLNEIERLLCPNWYTACFMKDYHNSSVWGHYADGHKGVCLIFESKQIGESNGFELYYGTGNSVRAIRLSKIRYEAKPAEVDFFRSIGRLTGKDVKEHWYTDEEGNISECASHIPRDGDMDSDEMVDWRNRHRNTFYRDITAKTKDWEYEQEYRLILEDGLSKFKEGENRALRYDFNSLKGIIFGIKTSDEDKQEIISIIRRKCEDHGRTGFKFFEAYYSPEDDKIHKRERRFLSL